VSAILKANWNYPTRVWHGPGRIAELPAACATLGIKRPLLVTDEGLRETPMIRNALALVPGTGLFAGVRGNPVAANIDAGLEVYRSGHHDGVIAFGGGSALDAGKVIAFMSGQTRPMWDFGTLVTGGRGPIPRASPRSSRCPPLRVPARKSVAPVSSSTRLHTRRRSSSTR